MKTIEAQAHPAPPPAPPAAPEPLRSPEPRLFSDEEVAELARAFALNFGTLSTARIESMGFLVEHLILLGWIKKTPGRWDAGWTYAGAFTDHYCQALTSR